MHEWGPSVYSLTLLLGVGISAWLWSRRSVAEPVLILIYVCGLLGALLGSHVVFWIAELPLRLEEARSWWRLLAGRTILGGLLGGYLGVELGKSWVGHTRSTGDAFAVIVPVSLCVGRVGCTLRGCCSGSILPWLSTTALEAGFHLTAAGLLAMLARYGKLRGQLFHVYLVAYGLFRIAMEVWRDTPRIPGAAWLSPYQVVAGALVMFALWRYRVRASDG